ncbi:hypothetical protein N9955_00620 [bacterium]|nr:hypothetical protein [bacterium]
MNEEMKNLARLKELSQHFEKLEGGRCCPDYKSMVEKYEGDPLFAEYKELYGWDVVRSMQRYGGGY